MENVYPPSQFRASDHIDLQQYFIGYSSAIKLSQPQIFINKKKGKTKRVDTYTDVMGMEMTQEEFMNLEKTCSIDQLRCSEESSGFPIELPEKFSLRTKLNIAIPCPESASSLEVIKRKEAMESIKSCEALLLMNKNNYHAPILEPCTSKSSPDLLLGTDFVVSLFFYKPFQFSFVSRNTTDKFRFSQEIEILGCQTLTQLRDIISCSSDTGIRAEQEIVTDNLSHLLKSKEIYPSASIFIDGVFYNDLRKSNAIDYSAPIREWAKEKGLGEFTHTDMEQTRIDSLKPRFGYPYVYLHQGNCEHLFVFADARLLTKEDCLISSQYPRVASLNRAVSILCYMCGVVVATWVCKNNDRLPQETTFLCAECCKSYNFINGKKIGNFQLYPLFDKCVDIPNVPTYDLT